MDKSPLLGTKALPATELYGTGEAPVEAARALPEARQAMETKCRMAAGAGAVLCAVSAIGLWIFMRADWFNDPGPFPSNAWEGYTKGDFVGLVLFTFCGPVGYVLLYLGVVNGAHATGDSGWVAAQVFLAVASIATGVAVYVRWGLYAMSCLSMFCLGDIRTLGSPYHEVVNLRPESGLGWLMTIGTSLGFAFVPFGLILLFRTYRNFWVATSVPSKHDEREAAPDGCASCATPDGHGVAPMRLWIEFTVFLLCFLIFSMTTFYIPNSWEYFTAPRIAANAQSIASMDYKKCTYEKTYICTELPWAYFWTTNLRVSKYLNLKLYPSNCFFCGYVLLTLIGAALMTHSGPKVAGFWSRALVSNNYGRWTRGEAAGTTLFALFMTLFVLYWQQSHNYDGYYPNLDNETLGGNIIGISWSERWSRTMGQIAQACLGLLLFAASRNAVMHRILGTSWESFLWVHRALGYGMLLTALLHMVFWWVKFAEIGQFPADIFSVPSHLPSSIDNFTVPHTTLCAWVMFVCMGVLAYEPLRRKSFELFYHSHLLAAYLIIPAVLWHGTNSWEYLLPGLTVWFLDRLLRLCRSQARVRVLAAVAHPHGVTELRFVLAGTAGCAGGRTYTPGQYVFINVPELSIFEWHPFTISSAPEAPYVSLHIKAMGKDREDGNSDQWTDRLHALVASINASGGYGEAAIAGPRMFTLCVDGPHGNPPDMLSGNAYDRVVLLCGGIGVTPCSSVFQSHVARLNASGAASIPVVRSTSFASSNGGINDDGAPRSPPSVQFHWMLRETELYQAAFARPLALASVAHQKHPRTDAPHAAASVHLTRVKRDQLAQVSGAAHYDLPRSDRPDPATIPRVVGDGSQVAMPNGVTLCAGRPDVDAVLQAMLEAGGEGPEASERMLVFVCGPEPLVKSAQDWCDAHGVDFHRETFLL